MPVSKIGAAIVAATAAGVLAVGGAALANAATVTGTPTAVAVSSDGDGGGGGSDHTPVTGDELAKVTAAVQAKDPSFTVSSVRKDPDGSYDVFGTKSGTPAGYEVSADLQTITESAGQGGRGGSDHTPVTGDELAKVTAAVQAKDPSFTVSSVRKDPDGSYDVFGTKSGTPAGYDVSADLQTITESTGHGGHH